MKAPVSAMGGTHILLGALDLLVLKTLDGGPQHGFGIAQHIQTASEGLLRAEDGSLYPALHRLERGGLVEAEWTRTEAGRRARVYRLTKAGRKELGRRVEHWETLRRGVKRVLRSG
ncbi:MAG: PadR family transcriptional regulator [Bryobacteraceae bacterium]